MPKEYQRTERLAELIQRELAKLLLEELRDPRLNLVTITRVEVSRDLSHAKVFVTQHKEEQVILETVKILNKTVKHLRHCLAQSLKLRVTPQLRFIYDASIEKSARLAALIDAALTSDNERKK